MYLHIASCFGAATNRKEKETYYWMSETDIQLIGVCDKESEILKLFDLWWWQDNVMFVKDFFQKNLYMVPKLLDDI